MTDQLVDSVIGLDGPYGQVILFGDSITQNGFEPEAGFSYGAALSHAFRRRQDVINRGFAGYNTDHARAVLPRFMPTTVQAKVELMIICFGANDACLPHDPTGHYVPVDSFRDNLIAMINSPEVQAHKPRILLVTPPPIDEKKQVLLDQAKGFAQCRRTAENTERYAATCREVGAELNIPVVDIWKRFLIHAGWVEGEAILGSRNASASETFQNLFSDGLHLLPAGYKLMFEEVMKCLKVNYPSFDPDATEFYYPSWETAPKWR